MRFLGISRMHAHTYLSTLAARAVTALNTTSRYASKERKLEQTRRSLHTSVSAAFRWRLCVCFSSPQLGGGWLGVDDELAVIVLCHSAIETEVKIMTTPKFSCLLLLFPWSLIIAFPALTDRTASAAASGSPRRSCATVIEAARQAVQLPPPQHTQHTGEYSPLPFNPPAAVLVIAYQ